MIIRLPFPDPALNPNRSKGKHWAATYKMREQQKQDAFYLARRAMQTQKLNVSDIYLLEIIFNRSDARKTDLDNLLSGAKNLLDGVALGLGINDRQFEPIILRRGREKFPSMVLKIGG